MAKADLIDRGELIADLNRFAPEHYSALVNMLIQKQQAVDAERLNEAFADLGAAAVEAARAFGRLVYCAAAAANAALRGLDGVVRMAAAYDAAKKENPDWVHRANFSKKKRTRKKYHNKIMQKYGR